MKEVNIFALQEKVDLTIRTLGGYWSPLSGLARVLEELGELGEIILKKQFDDEFSMELSDVFIITLCLANQYCARIERIADIPFLELTVQETYFRLVADCGELARIVNSYEGNKKLKPLEHPTTVEKQVLSVCRAIIALAKKMDLEIVTVVDATLLKVRKRDLGRFDILYDPSLSSSRDEYIRLIHPSEKVWGLRDSKQTSLEQDLIMNRDTISRFLKFGQIEQISSLVMKLPEGEYDVSNLGEFLGRIAVSTVSSFLVISRM
jgi:NTP pyrophosphatase (non-canonical NTP hydrolase)